MPTPKGFTSKDMAPIHWAWFLGHEKLAKLSTRGSNIIVPNSNHYIQYDQPEAVIEAVRRVIMDIRDH